MPYPGLLTQSPCPCGGPLLTHTSAGDTQTQFWLSLWGVSGSWCTQGSICTLQESISSVLCKFWQLCGGVNGDLLQEGLSHTQVCCTQSPCLCSSPLLTHTATSEVAQSCLTLYDSMNSSLHQAPPSMGFSRQEYWSGLPFPFPGNLPDPGIEPRSPAL